MTFKITVANTSQVFEAEVGETILDAALRHGVRVRYGCRQGKCSSCKHYVTEGEFDNSRASAYALLYEEREEGMTLLCQTYPESDCTIELVTDDEDDSVVLPPPKATHGTVTATEPLTTTLWHVELKLDRPMWFLPGQYVEVGTPENPASTRTYCVASAPSNPRRLQLVVERRDGGAFSGFLGSEDRPYVAVHGPFGQMYLRPSGRPLILMAEGAGIAPMLSIVRSTTREEWGAPIDLLHSGVSVDDLAGRKEMTAWAGSAPDRGYHPVVGGGMAAVLAAGPSDLHGADAYVAGSEAFCEQGIFLLEARGVASDRIHVERFYAAESPS